MNKNAEESRRLGRKILEHSAYGVAIASHVTGDFPEITDNGYSDSAKPPLKSYSKELNQDSVIHTQVNESGESENLVPQNSPISYGTLEQLYMKSFTVEEETDSMLNKIPGVNITEEVKDLEKGYDPITIDEVMKNQDLQEIAHCINFNYEMDTHEALNVNKQERRYPEVDIKIISSQGNINLLAGEFRENHEEIDSIELFRGLFPNDQSPGANNIIDGIEANL